MSQSLVQIYVHIVFSTKERRPFMQDPIIRGRLHGYLQGICEKQKSPSIAINGVEDHVHILCRLGKTLDVSAFIKALKQSSSIWIKSEFANQKAFHLQNGYGAFSVSPFHVPALVECIQNQEQHHHRESFQDEFRRLLKKYGVEYDERYLWN